jgi:hypothetical protein
MGQADKELACLWKMRTISCSEAYVRAETHYPHVTCSALDALVTPQEKCATTEM